MVWISANYEEAGRLLGLGVRESGLSHDTEVDTTPEDSRLTIAYQGVGV